MNYLAHVLLAEDDAQSIIGNLMADTLKRSDFDRLPVRIQKGIRQHRQVDSFTDRHPVVIRRLGNAYGWFGGIIIDVYYDHLLALNWDQFCSTPLREFCDDVHEYLHQSMEEMPYEGQYLARRLIQLDRLYSYTTLEGISCALESISERLKIRMPKLNVRLQDAIPDLKMLHPELTEDFQEFFPQLQSFSQTWLESPQAPRRITA
jgi:acyl carrier protein phosphodiesterase